ncbi:hypothetical protein A3K70_01925 [Candidatus Bathyarchaeota archaeon RBG_16_48_13]|nr:MAG: hypothetical protein A3K70_01925 [Candidatus Bathyarchaeota archaeon RBG_16_48_13]
MNLPILRNIKPSNQIYWIRVILAMLSALICSPFVLNLSGFFGAVVTVLLYAASYYLLRDVIKIDVAAVGGRRKLIQIGVGTYVIVWILVWTVLNTIAIF